MFHENDTVEVGADTKFLTFRPGLWDRATTPYEEPFTRCAAKPELICFWLSDEAAGPRFARFILRSVSLGHDSCLVELSIKFSHSPTDIPGLKNG